jgi:peptidoglycan/xylan/chitin deacetylase (PgdA/CDA1 family)
LKLIKNNFTWLGIFVVVIVLLVTGSMILPTNQVYAQPTVTGKYIIFTFDDGTRDQYVNAKPVLDKYGYKATFFIVCGWINTQNQMTWSDLTDLKNNGMDIESHTMTHPNLNTLSADQLTFETGGAQSCLAHHGFSTTVFAYPRDLGYTNATVVNAVSQYYKSAKTSDEKIWSLTCHGYRQTQNQTDCSTYYPNGNPQFANRYAIRMHSIDADEKAFNWNDTAVFNDWVNNWVNLQTQYNINGAILAVPVITFHYIDPGTTPSSWLHINQTFLDKLLGYLHDNGFQVLTLNQLGYDNNTNSMYIKGLSPTNLNGTLVTLNPINSARWGTTVTVTGKLTDQSGNGLGGKTIVFTGTGTANLQPVTTKSDGTFSVSGKAPSTVANGWKVNAIFAGDSSYDSNFDTRNYNTIKHSVSLTLLISPSSVVQNSQYGVSGILKDKTTGTSLGSMTISFTADSPITIPSTVTNSNGKYLVSGLTAPSTAGSYSIKAQFAGDNFYNTYSVTRTLSVT